MAYETYDKGTTGCDKFGHHKSGWGSGTGVKYPDKGLPSKQDDRGMSRITQHGCGCSAPGDTYPKGTVGHQKFRNLEGI